MSWISRLRSYAERSLFRKITGVVAIALTASLVVAVCAFFQARALQDHANTWAVAAELEAVDGLVQQFKTERDTSLIPVLYQRTEALREHAQAYTSKQASAALLDEVAMYEEHFAVLVERVTERGFTETQGAEGRLRQSVHAVETLIKAAGEDRLLVDMLMARRSEKDYFMRGTEKYVGRVAKAVSDLKAHMGLSSLDEEAQAEVTTRIDAYQRDFEASVAALTAMDEAYAQLKEDQARVGALVSQQVAEATRRAEWIGYGLWSGMALVIVVTVLIALRVIRSIVRPIQKLSAAASAVAQGDLETQVAVTTQDETATLADGFNAMVQQVWRLIQQVEEDKCVAEAQRATIDMQQAYLQANVQVAKRFAAVLHRRPARYADACDSRPGTAGR